MLRGHLRVRLCVAAPVPEEREDRHARRELVNGRRVHELVRLRVSIAITCVEENIVWCADGN